MQTEQEEQKTERVLRVQSVLYGTELTQIWRLLRGLEAAAVKVLGAGLVDRVDWALGDSSPSPVLTSDDVDALSQAAQTLSHVTYEYFDENLGSSGGQNRLSKGAPSTLIFVLNPDTYPAPDALVELTKALYGVGVGIADARQIPLEHPKLYDVQTGDTSWASGACMMVWTELFTDVGGFDHEHFLLHCDDVDLSWRVRAAGWRVVNAPLATVFHDKRPTMDTHWPMPDVERYQSVLGRLMLATRWGRPDILQQTIDYIESDGNEVTEAAVAEFRRRRAAGKVPALSANPSVAEFVDGEYAVHRY